MQNFFVVINFIFNTYTTFNKEPKPVAEGEAGLLPSGMQATGLGMDVAAASKNIPIKYHLHADGADNPSHIVELKFAKGEDLLMSFFGPMDTDRMSFISGRVLYRKNDGNTMPTIVSSRYYNASDQADIRDLKKAMALKDANSFPPETIERLKIAEKENPDFNSVQLIHPIYDVDAYLQDSLCAPMTTITITPSEIIHAKDLE